MGESSKAITSKTAMMESKQARYPQLFDKAEDFPLAGFCARDGPLHIRLEIRRIYQGKAKKRSSRFWHWGAAFALLAGRSNYTWPLSKQACETWMAKSLKQWVEGQYGQWEDFLVINEGDDGWYKIIPKKYVVRMRQTLHFATQSS